MRSTVNLHRNNASTYRPHFFRLPEVSREGSAIHKLTQVLCQVKTKRKTPVTVSSYRRFGLDKLPSQSVHPFFAKYPQSIQTLSGPVRNSLPQSPGIAIGGQSRVERNRRMQTRFLGFQMTACAGTFVPPYRLNRRGRRFRIRFWPIGR